MAHVNIQKKETVAKLTKDLKEATIIGVLNMESLPAGNLAAMRKKLRGKVQMIMAKKRLIKIALKESGKPNVEKLEPYLKGMPALLFTKDNPFTLFKILKQNQSKAPIKAGQKAPQDLVLPAGPTSFPPGPIIGELGQLGVKAGIQDGKVVIKQDCVLVKEDGVVNDKQAGLLARMGIEPMRIGLTLTAVYENGEVVDAKVLDIDEDKFKKDLGKAAWDARALAIELGIPTKEIIDTLIQKAHYDAAGLALEANLLTDATARQVLAKAYWQAVGVAKYLPDDERDALPQAPAAAEASAPAKEEKKEEKKEEDAAAGLGALFG